MIDNTYLFAFISSLIIALLNVTYKRALWLHDNTTYQICVHYNFINFYVKFVSNQM